MGFEIDQDHIFSSLSAARSVINQRQLNPYLILEDAAMEVNICTKDSVVIIIAFTKVEVKDKIRNFFN